VSFETVAFRATGYFRPLWAFPNLDDGRYNIAGRYPAQYLALHPMGPWAEMLRNLNRRTDDQARTMRLPIWTFRLTLGDEPVEISFDTAGSYGLNPEDLVADDQSATRALGAALSSSGVASFTAPSAALPGTTNLIVLQPAAIIDYHATPIDPEDWPSALVSQDGRCPEGLWDEVHYRGAGTTHAALDAWLSGSVFEFIQPDVTAASLAAV
jgi:hypothetical protein